MSALVWVVLVLLAMDVLVKVVRLARSEFTQPPETLALGLLLNVALLVWCAWELAGAST